MHAPPHFLFDRSQLRPHAIAPGLPQKQEGSLAGFATDDEAQEAKTLRFAKPTPQALPPHVQMIQMGRAYGVSRIVYAAAKLGLAEQLASGPKSAAELAGPMSVHPSPGRLRPLLQAVRRCRSGIFIS